MLKKARRGVSHMKEKENDPMERPMQGRSCPFLGVRVEEGLPRVVDWEDPLATTGDLPTEAIDPRAYGFKFKLYRATTVTGSWPSEGKQHGHLFLHTRELENHFRRIHGQLNVPDAIKHKALLATFTQAMAHATYLGFGPVTEITYPLVQQSTFTDGQRWILGLYQLNTCALHSERAVQNPRNNILWLSEDQHLFECVEAGRVKGLNMSLLTALIAMYLKRGVQNPDPTPYLSFKYVSNHPASEEYRERFHQYYLRLTSNRPLARERPEMYLWEKIYKVDFNTRPLETPRRFFENYYKKEDPGKRPLNQHPPRYIPKSKRKEKRVKFEPVVDSEQLYKYD
ncbi:hypothetical protein O3P69_004739 [Scylla paramamosain]|uniref:Uncharacterized protein n=1 Tax=Scylla paramamosain TaxID=85552 RepID=A0AAW0UAU9_SCYPA